MEWVGLDYVCNGDGFASRVNDRREFQWGISRLFHSKNSGLPKSLQFTVSMCSFGVFLEPAIEFIRRGFWAEGSAEGEV